MIVIRFLISALALAMIGFGLVLTISPIPFGFVIVILGMLLFASVAPAEVRWIRRRWRWFDRMMHGLEKRLPRWIAKRLSDSDYDHSEDEDEIEESPQQKGRAKHQARR